jgi:hypothetical protein
MPQAHVTSSSFSLSIAQKIQGLHVGYGIPAEISPGIPHDAIRAIGYDATRLLCMEVATRLQVKLWKAELYKLGL